MVDDFARLRHLAETQRLLTSSSLGADERLQAVAERAQAITSADAALIELLDGEELVHRASTGTMEGSLGLRIKVASTISGRCVRLGVPMRCVDTEYDTRVDRAGCRRLGIRSMVVVPVMKGDAAIGVLKVISSRPDHFGEPDLEVLQEMAGLVAGALAHPPAGDGTQPGTSHVATPADRRLFVESLERACAAADRDGTALAVLVIRLNGADAGQERLVRLVAEGLSKIVRGGDILTRLGDEFALVCHDARETDAYGIVARISSAVRRVAESEPRYGHVSAGVGLAWMDEDHRSAERLLSAASASLTAG